MYRTKDFLQKILRLKCYLTSRNSSKKVDTALLSAKFEKLTIPPFDYGT